MKKIYLTSSGQLVAKNIAQDLNLKAPKNKLAFIKTASEPEEGDLSWLKNDRQALVDAGFEVADYTLTDKTKEQVKEDLQDKDFLYFSGGNTFYLLEKFRQSESESVIREFLDQGKIYIGTSAGSIVTGPDISLVRGIDNVKVTKLADFTGLKLVNFITFPHWGRPDFKERYLDERIERSFDESKYPVILLRDNQYIKVEDDKIQIITV